MDSWSIILLYSLFVQLYAFMIVYRLVANLTLYLGNQLFAGKSFGLNHIQAEVYEAAHRNQAIEKKDISNSIGANHNFWDHGDEESKDPDCAYNKGDIFHHLCNVKHADWS